MKKTIILLDDAAKSRHITRYRIYNYLRSGQLTTHWGPSRHRHPRSTLYIDTDELDKLILSSRETRLQPPPDGYITALAAATQLQRSVANLRRMRIPWEIRHCYQPASRHCHYHQLDIHRTATLIHSNLPARPLGSYPTPPRPISITHAAELLGISHNLLSHCITAQLITSRRDQHGEIILFLCEIEELRGKHRDN